MKNAPHDPIPRTILDAAIAYLSHRLCPIPLPYGQKKPAIPWKEFQTRLPTQVEITRSFGNGLSNIAVVCGRVSGNLTVLDFDAHDGCERLFGDLSKLFRKTTVVATSRGLHVYCQTTQPVSSFRIKDLNLEVLSNGHFVLAPPSLHPTGVRYSFVSKVREPMLVDDLTGAIRSRCRELGIRFPHLENENAEKVVPSNLAMGQITLKEHQRNAVIRSLTPFWKKGQRHQLTLYLCGYLMKRGVAYEDAYKIITGICDSASDEEKQDRLSNVTYHYRNRVGLLPRLKGFSGLREILTGETID